jgi:predicted transcriptional regulator
MTEYRRTRKAIGVSQLAVAHEAKLAPSYLSLVETGYLRPPEQHRRKILRALQRLAARRQRAVAAIQAFA